MHETLAVILSSIGIAGAGVAILSHYFVPRNACTKTREKCVDHVKQEEKAARMALSNMICEKLTALEKRMNSRFDRIEQQIIEMDRKRELARDEQEKKNEQLFIAIGELRGKI